MDSGRDGREMHTTFRQIQLKDDIITITIGDVSRR